ncbi:hypothetical protein ADEAN_000440800 [Angomonas deanei]|uniref:Uncharacterized protein n=1 Tax=Angomonas deanei TaxID=59799 RepID=A0A7G2CAN6_9TRYP|nr:hypothetical protein ADEAN_000440800 [Angomonas deanei]
MVGVEQPADEEEDAHSPERKLELSENEEKETREKMDISNVKNAFVKRNTWVEEGEKKEKEESEEKKEEDSTPPPTRPPPKVLSPPPPPQEEEEEEKAEEEEDEYFGNKPEEAKEL